LGTKGSVLRKETLPLLGYLSQGLVMMKGY